MRVRIDPATGQVEIVDPTWEELDELISRYGGGISVRTEEKRDHTNGHATQRTGMAPADRVVLERLIAADNAGVPTQELGETLGKLGKSIRPAMLEWARRVGLTNDNESVEPFEECRSGTRRGLRLKGSMIAVAKALLK